MRVPEVVRSSINRAIAVRVAQQVEPARADAAGRDEQLAAELSGALARVAALEERLQRSDDALAELQRRVGEQEGRQGYVDGRLDRLEGDLAWNSSEIERLAPQAASFESRLERAARPIVVTGELESLPEARLLVDVVREEHARARARLALISAYEERIRRLEARVAQYASAPTEVPG